MSFIKLDPTHRKHDKQVCKVVIYLIHLNLIVFLAGRYYEVNSERFELGETLIDDVKSELNSDDEKSDSQILFDILSRDKRYSL